MSTIQEVADAFSVTTDQVKLLRSAMSRTWGQICYDYVDCFDGGETEMYELFDNDESALIAEATIDADRVTTFCPDMELGWVYRLEDGSWRPNCIEMAKAVWTAS